MATIFEKDMVTIPQNKYEELIKTSQKYEFLYNLMYQKMSKVFDDALDYLKAIDNERFENSKNEGD